MREIFWMTCGLAVDHLFGLAFLVARGPTAAAEHMRARIYGWPAEGRKSWIG
jgi:hypothetical protein